MLSLFGFGKRRRRSTKSRKSAKKGGRGRKPPAALLRMCKKYKVKSTVKRGTKRVYKKARLLKKLCMRKKKMMLKKKKSSKRTKSRKVRRTRRVRRSRFGGALEKAYNMNGGKNFMFGASCGSKYNDSMGFGRKRSPKSKFSRAAKEFSEFYNDNIGNRFGGVLDNIVASKDLPLPNPVKLTGFGKKRSKKLSKPAAMKAFKQFYRRHCRSSRMGGRFRFGSGGNPPLSGGYEFCPSGQGGVLGANSTGLFPSPCTPAAFGRRYKPRTYRSKCYGKGKSKYCLKLKPKYKDLYFVKEREARRRRI
jgi:hypothetical protein